MRIVDRYILREMLSSLGLGLLLFTVVLFTGRLLKLMELIVTRGVRPGYFEEPLRQLTDELRCRHPDPPAAPAQVDGGTPSQGASAGAGAPRPEAPR